MENFIQLKKDNIFRVGIRDVEGNETGEHLEFDLEDIELPFRINDCEKMHNENVQKLKAEMIIINKKQDKKGKYLLSANEEAKLKAIKEFYNEEEKALDLFLGEGGTRKLLNGRKPYYSMYDDISEMLEPIMPKLTERVTSIEDKIKEKYKINKDEDNVL